MNQTKSATRFSFYNYDHLGNTRVTYTSKCSSGTVYLTTQTALDYYPYGKELRAYNSGDGGYVLAGYQYNTRCKQLGYLK